jgi:hypothetical protein
MSNIPQNIQSPSQLTNPINSAFNLYSNHYYKTNFYYNYLLYQYYYNQYREFIEMVRSNDTPAVKVESCLWNSESPNKGTNLSSSSLNDNAFLNEKRVRSVKNNKLVYVHNKVSSGQENKKKVCLFLFRIIIFLPQNQFTPIKGNLQVNFFSFR